MSDFSWDDVKEQLLEAAPVIDCDENFRLSTYYNRAHSLREQARMFLESFKFENAFVTLMRFCNLVTLTIPNHPSYKDKKFKRERTKYRRWVMEAMDVLEALKRNLKDKYDNMQIVDDEVDDSDDEKIDDRVARNSSDDMAAAVAAAAASAPAIDELGDDEKTDDAPATSPKDRWASLRVPSTAYADDNAPVARNKAKKALQKIISSKTTVRVPLDVMETFLRIALPNTRKDIETCGILTGAMKGGDFHITHVLLLATKV